jgi:hypothetical protein
MSLPVLAITNASTQAGALGYHELTSRGTPLVLDACGWKQIAAKGASAVPIRLGSRRQRQTLRKGEWRRSLR